MKNDTQDKQYLALELTKIKYQQAQNIVSSDVADAYEYFFKRLTDTIGDVDTITTLKNEINKLQKENEHFKDDNQVVVKRLCEDIMYVLTSAKGDMEPYVYGSLVNIIKSKIQ